jgi:MoxR-like ATPase
LIWDRNHFTVDEIFKANSAILNSLLTILNERKFDNGHVREDIPLFAVVGASNELPDSEELVRMTRRRQCVCHIPAHVASVAVRSQLGHKLASISNVYLTLTFCSTTQQE